jgi:hypothetical protein
MERVAHHAEMQLARGNRANEEHRQRQGLREYEGRLSEEEETEVSNEQGGG